MTRGLEPKSCEDIRTWPDLTWPFLTGPDQIWPDMTWSDLTGPDLTWPDLTGPDLTWPDLTWPDLSCCHVSDICIIGIVYWICFVLWLSFPASFFPLMFFLPLTNIHNDHVSHFLRSQFLSVHPLIERNILSISSILYLYVDFSQVTVASALAWAAAEGVADAFASQVLFWMTGE